MIVIRARGRGGWPRGGADQSPGSPGARRPGGRPRRDPRRDPRARGIDKIRNERNGTAGASRVAWLEKKR